MKYSKKNIRTVRTSFIIFYVAIAVKIIHIFLIIGMKIIKTVKTQGHIKHIWFVTQKGITSLGCVKRFGE